MLDIFVELHKAVGPILTDVVSRASFFATSSKVEMQAW